MLYKNKPLKRKKKKSIIIGMHMQKLLSAFAPKSACPNSKIFETQGSYLAMRMKGMDKKTMKKRNKMKS